MNSANAEALSLLVLQLNAKMNDSVAFVKEKGTPGEFDAYRLQAAEVMGALHGIAETLYARYPHLRPRELGGAYSIDPAVFEAGLLPALGRSMGQEIANRDIANARRELLAVENMLRAMRGEPPLSFLPEQCGFCARSETEAGALVEGIGVYICEGCADSALRKMRGNKG